MQLFLLLSPYSFFLSLFLIGILVSGTEKLKNNNIKMITGRVMGVGKSGNAEASVSYYPIVETDTGKKVKLDGITHETDDFEIGSKYHFLSLYSVQVIVSEVAEKEYQPPTRRSSFD